jgi:hypothetical protein
MRSGVVRAAVLASVLGVGGLAAGARAQVVYDSITGNTRRSSLIMEDEFAQNLVLSMGAAIGQVEVGVQRNPALTNAYTGAMTVRLWADVGGAPGALLGESIVPLSLGDNLVHIVAAGFASGVQVASGRVWTGVQFSNSGQLGAGLVMGWDDPTIGTLGGLHGRHYPDGTWNIATTFDPVYLRVSAVPSPAGPLLLGLGVLAARRRARQNGNAPAAQARGVTVVAGLLERLGPYAAIFPPWAEPRPAPPKAETPGPLRRTVNIAVSPSEGPRRGVMR